MRLRQSLARSGRVLTPYRAGVTTDGLKHNKYRSRCFGRGACGRRAGGCDIHAAFDSPTGLIYPALDTGRLTLRTGSIAREVTVDPGTGKARGVAFLDAESGATIEARDGWWCWPPRPWSRRACCCSPARRSTRTASATPAATSATTSAST